MIIIICPICSWDFHRKDYKEAEKDFNRHWNRLHAVFWGWPRYPKVIYIREMTNET